MTPILPGGTLGVLGSGQLGRMFTVAARQLGYRVHVFSPESDSPTGHVADREFVAGYEDLDAVADFAKSVDVVTFEFENVSAAATETAEKFAPVRPAGRVLHTTQQRLREKTALHAAGLPVTPFRAVHSLEELTQAVAELGTPSVLKTAAWGYDGKGQTVIRTADEAPLAWSLLQTDAAVLEAFVDFRCEVSVVAVRSADGSAAFYPPVENRHRNHILDVSLFPFSNGSAEDEAVCAAAGEIARQVMTALDVVGVLCIEFFVTDDNQLMINELAPRPHNSGHLTIEAAATSQFEQQVRAICGLPVGSTGVRSPTVMVNLLGDIWRNGTPHWTAALAEPEAHLHLYGKSDPRPGRKMGHLTVLAESTAIACERAIAIRAALAD